MLHTDNQYFRVEVRSDPVLVVGPANRKRIVDINISTFGLPIWVGENQQLNPLNGRLVNRWKGLKYDLGPNQSLFAVTVGPFAGILHGNVTDRNDEGLFTDVGSGDAVPGGGRGSAETPVAASPRPVAGRTARD